MMAVHIVTGILGEDIWHIQVFGFALNTIFVTFTLVNVWFAISTNFEYIWTCGAGSFKIHTGWSGF